MRDEASASFGQEADQEKPFCFMRWKERFLVPDHKVRDISGASFAGTHKPYVAVAKADCRHVRQASTIFSLILIRLRLQASDFVFHHPWVLTSL